MLRDLYPELPNRLDLLFLGLGVDRLGPEVLGCSSGSSVPPGLRFLVEELLLGSNPSGKKP